MANSGLIDWRETANLASMPRPNTALIIDDEAHVRAYFREILKGFDVATVWEATDGEQGLSLAREHRPGLVLLEINLPVLGGIEVLTRLQAEAPEVPVIIVTSENRLQTVRDAQRLGAVAYLLKHSPREDLIASLRDALDYLENPEDEDAIDNESATDDSDDSEVDGKPRS